jgi:hypothetical protein
MRYSDREGLYSDREGRYSEKGQGSKAPQAFQRQQGYLTTGGLD